MKPLISIIVPTFNRSALLSETLASVKNQSLKDWECIIVDDGSIDDTPSLLENLINQDRRFKYYHRPLSYTKGACSCRNYGFKMSSGKFIQWLDDDDLLSPTKLELQVEKLIKIDDPSIFTTCDWDLFWQGKTYEKKNILGTNSFLHPKEYFLQLRKQQTFVPSHTFLMSRSIILNAGLWNTFLKVNQDAEFITRILLVSKKLINTKNCHVLYRDHQGVRISSTRDVEILRSLILSYRLIHSYLKFQGTSCQDFFKWKLHKILLENGGKTNEIIRDHFHFFQENGVNPNFKKYYSVRHFIYKTVKGNYKRYRKN